MTLPPRSTIEDAALDAWPALSDSHCDAWRLRLSEGFTDRANSATFAGPGRQALPLSESIAECETQFAARKLSPTFRLPSFCTPPPVEHALTERGYRATKKTRVLQRRVADVAATTGTNKAEGQLRPLQDVDSWLDHYAAFGEKGAHTEAAHSRILKAIAPPHLLACWEVKGEIVGCGLAVHNGPLCGVFDVAIASPHRRRGYGRQLVEALVHWGRTCDAQIAYLQVEETNASALRLYRNLKFTERYFYRYWRRE